MLVEVISKNIDRTKFRYFLVSFDDRRIVAKSHPSEERERDTLMYFNSLIACPY